VKKVVVLALILALSSGCAFWRKEKEKSAEELAHEGMARMDKGRYSQAIESFERLRDWYPFSKFAILAELKLGDAYYETKRWDEAVAAYEQFESLHPNNEAAPYAVYRIGMCWFEQIRPPDRDQTYAQKALDAFTRLSSQHPDSLFAVKAAEHIRVCLERLARHEMSVARFYFRGKQYQAAEDRLTSLLADYPDVGVHQEALEFLARVRVKLAEEKAEKS